MENDRKKKVFISQPMAAKTDFEIEEERAKAVCVLEERGYEVVDSLYEFSSEWYNPTYLHNRGVCHIPLYFLAHSLEKMSYCDAVYFCKGWENARGCKIEHEAAVAYGYEIIYE